MAERDEEMVSLDFGTDEPQVEDAAFELQVDDSIETKPVVDSAELEARLAALQEEKEALKAQADTSSQMTAAFQGLAEQLKTQNAPKEEAKAAGPPGLNVDWAALEAQVNAETFKNPFQGTMKAVAPAFQQLQNDFKFQIDQIKKENDALKNKVSINSSPELKVTYDKYSAEVDAAISSGKDAQTAVKEVQMAHLDDIVAEKVAAALESAQAPQSKPVPPSFTNSGSMSSAAARGGATAGPKVSSAVYAKMRQDALNWAMNPDDPDDMEDVYETYVNRGWIKK